MVDEVPAPVPVAFSLTPALANSGGVIDYSTSEGIKLYGAATRPLRIEQYHQSSIDIDHHKINNCPGPRAIARILFFRSLFVQPRSVRSAVASFTSTTQKEGTSSSGAATDRSFFRHRKSSINHQSSIPDFRDLYLFTFTILLANCIAHRSSQLR